MERILLLEDDKSLVTGLTLALGRAGYALDTARTLAEAGHLWQAGRYDLLMLDVTLPDGTGFDFCREVRRTSGVPILFLTASDEEMDIITGLDLGGDDYITKPFKLGVLLSRVHALLRRAGGFGAQQATELCSGGIRVDLLAGRAEKNGVPLELTAAEYKLLCLFLRSPGQVLTKETILNALWDCEGNYVDTNTLTVYIRRLRLKVEDDPGSCLPGCAPGWLRPCWRQNARRGHCARHCACRCWGCLSFWRPGCWAVPLLILLDGRNGWRKRLRRCVPCWTGTPLPGWTAAVKGSCTGCSMK